MQKAQAQNIVKETFENAFDEERFRHFVRNLLNHIEEEDKHPYSGQFIPAAFQTHIATLKRIGKYLQGEHEIDILVVSLKKGTTLGRARTAQRNFIARYLNGSRGGKMKDAALVAFVSPNEVDWRFSLIKMDYRFTEGKNGKIKVKEEFTPARRWSFLVGPNEHSHTAQAKFIPIIEDENAITLARLEDAFNIEKVTKEFFEKYRELFLRAKESLDELVKNDKQLRNDFEEKFVNTADFVKKLLGQIVFLYFLQKKGWFGVELGKNWGTGSKRFMRDLFEGKIISYKNFFNDVLEPLFYDALARDRSDVDHFNPHFNCKIPFLNGGLFDPINGYSWEKTEINLPNDLFSNGRKTKEGDEGDGILDIFDRYNFTVKEDEPLEKEVAIDPEMLGKVFENLLAVKDRKSKGTYYTPREIVHYMCEQSLLNYLATELEGLPARGAQAGKVAKEDLDQLIKVGENVAEHEAVSVSKEDNPEYGGDYKRLLPDSIKEFAQEIDEKLATIKVCDPAIGSGAFPVGMMNAIIKTRLVLSSYIKDENRTAYNFKRDCIQNSLYGVDIDPGAVEIAKLRLWLSLVVDEESFKEIKPLPNLDYKIMQGNSLLEEFEGIKLFDEKLLSITSKQDIENEINQINNLNKENDSKRLQFYEKNPRWMKDKNIEKPPELLILENDQKVLEAKKKVLLDKLKDFALVSQQKELSIYQKSRAKSLGEDLKRLHTEFFEATQKSKKDNIKNQIEQLEWELIEATLKEQNKTSALKKLEEFKRSNTKPFFLWRLNFADVFEEKGGFDVVIANPPYGETIKENKDQFKKDYSCAQGKFEIFKFFIEKGIGLSKVNGILTYITPDTWLLLGSFQKLRKIIVKENHLLQVSESLYNKFESVTVDTIVFIIKKEISGSPTKLVSDGFLPLRDLDSFENDGFVINIKVKPKIIEKIEKIRNCVDRYCEVWQGLIAYHSKNQKRIYSSKTQITQKHRRLLFGSGIGKYVIKWQGEYLKYGSWLHRPRPSYIFDNEKILIQRIRNPQLKERIIATYDNEGFINGTGLSNILIRDEYKGQLDILYILALVNSNLINYWFSYHFKDVNIKPEQIRKIPIKEIEYLSQKPFIKLVKKILKITKAENYLKNGEKQAKVRDLEHQIDELVYKLYGLTKEEIEIVEAKI